MDSQREAMCKNDSRLLQELANRAAARTHIWGKVGVNEMQGPGQRVTVEHPFVAANNGWRWSRPSARSLPPLTGASRGWAMPLAAMAETIFFTIDGPHWSTGRCRSCPWCDHSQQKCHCPQRGHRTPIMGMGSEVMFGRLVGILRDGGDGLQAVAQRSVEV